MIHQQYLKRFIYIICKMYIWTHRCVLRQDINYERDSYGGPDFRDFSITYHNEVETGKLVPSLVASLLDFIEKMHGSL